MLAWFDFRPRLPVDEANRRQAIWWLCIGSISGRAPDRRATADACSTKQSQIRQNGSVTIPLLLRETTNEANPVGLTFASRARISDMNDDRAQTGNRAASVTTKSTKQSHWYSGRSLSVTLTKAMRAIAFDHERSQGPCPNPGRLTLG